MLRKVAQALVVVMVMVVVATMEGSYCMIPDTEFSRDP